jgi:hypothetical protein
VLRIGKRRRGKVSSNLIKEGLDYNSAYLEFCEEIGGI